MSEALGFTPELHDGNIRSYLYHNEVISCAVGPEQVKEVLITAEPIAEGDNTVARIFAGNSRYHIERYEEPDKKTRLTLFETAVESRKVMFYPLYPEVIKTIGRNNALHNEADKHLSREHFTVEWDGGDTIRITDVSTNGTVVESRTVAYQEAL